VPVTDTQSLGDHPTSDILDAVDEVAVSLVPSGIGPLDERTGGLKCGGSYLIVGTPGPAKMVAAFQFLFAGLERGEPGVLLSNADEEGSLGVARAWGFDFDRYWRDGTLRILGFKDDFELRAIRSVEPEEVLEELGMVVGQEPMRIAVDPGSLFLAGGVKSLLGASFLRWARNHPATVCTTFSIDGATTGLPSAADWLVNASTGRLILEWRAEDLYQLTLAKAVPEAGDREEAISVQLKPAAGLVTPESWPSRRGRDRPGVNEDRLLLISLGGEHAQDVEAWASGSFTADVVSEPFEAVARVQSDPTFGGVLIHAPRARIREAVQACRALRPLTRAAILFASDDAIRSTDRIQILEAGVDDCLSGVIDFRELDLRIRQAIASGSKPVPEAANGQTGDPSLTSVIAEGGRMSLADFATELRRRAANPVLTFFCVLDVASAAIELSALEDLLADHVRCDEGDLVASNSRGCVVLLQGAREGQLEPFLARLRTRIGERAGEGGAPDLALDVLSHPAESARIRTLLGIEGGSEA